MRRSTFVRVLLAGAVLALAALAIRLLYEQPEEVATATSGPAALTDLGQQNRARIEALRAELNRARATPAQPAPAAPATPTSSRYAASMIADVRSELKILASARTMFNRDELIREEMARLARDPRHVALAIDVATDWQLATQLFGDEQAQARVYSLQLLRHMAETGTLHGVETAVDRIGVAMNAEEPWKKGIEYDYVDALSVYLRSVGIDQFLSEPMTYFDRMHLSERTSVEVQKAMYDSGILRDASPTVLAQVRKDFWSYLGKGPPNG
jgi:hypothetical protein